MDTNIGRLKHTSQKIMVNCFTRSGVSLSAPIHIEHIVSLLVELRYGPRCCAVRLPREAMANDPPDDRSLAVYEAGARFHASTLACLEKALISLSSTDNEGHKMFLLNLREQSLRGLRVMKLLAVTWHRDRAERQERRDTAERLIRQRYHDLTARHRRR